MQKILILILSVLFLSSFCLATDVNLSIKTIYPDTSPYYVGTTITSLKLDIIKDSVNKNDDYNTIEISIGESKFTLKKVSKQFSINPNYIILPTDVKSNELAIKIITPIEGLVNNTFKIRVLDPNEIFRYNIDGLNSVYNKNQDAEINIRFDIIKSATNLGCYVTNPTVDDRVVSCNNNICSKVIRAQDTNGYFNASILCSVTYNNKQIPQNIILHIPLSNQLNIDMVNPKDGLVLNPFSVDLNVSYSNGLKLESDDLELYVNGLLKSASVNDGILSYNSLLIPFTDFNDSVMIKYRDSSYTKDFTLSLRPAYWFWIAIALVLLVIIVNISLLIYKVYKKEDLDVLIQTRDSYMQKLNEIKQQFSTLRITKATFDELSQEYQINISNLNSKIVKLKGMQNAKKEHLDRIENEIKKPAELKPKLIEPPKDLINSLKAKPKPIITEQPLKVENDDDNKDAPKKSFFSRLFGFSSNDNKKETIDDKKTLDQKIEMLKKNVQKKDDKKESSDTEGFNIDDWKK